jgi:hypothetical protein
MNFTVDKILKIGILIQLLFLVKNIIISSQKIECADIFTLAGVKNE